MKKVINAGIGGRSFAIDEDAYVRLKQYLDAFRTKSRLGLQSKEVMEDLEERIAELFSEQMTDFRNVVDMALVDKVIAQLGMPDGEPYKDADGTSNPVHDLFNGQMPSRKLYRNPDDKAIGGVCSGLAAYLGVDTLLMRIVFIVVLFMGSAGFWIYVILWIAAPLASGPVQKCEMFGLPATAENLRKFSNNK